MTADRWGAIIAAHYKLPLDKAYNGIELNKAIIATRWLTGAMDLSGDVPSHHCNVYRKRYRPDNESASCRVWCYYSAPKGEKPFKKILKSMV